MTAAVTFRPLTPLEDAELRYDEQPNASNERAWQEAKRAAEIADVKARAAARKLAEEQARAKEKAAAEKRKRLAELVPVCNGFPAAIAEHVEWFARAQMEALRRIESGLAAIDRQRAAVREATRLAAELGVTIEIASEMHEGNLRGIIARAQGAALRKASTKEASMIRASVSEYFRPSAEAE